MKRLWQLGNILSLLFALVANIVIGAQLIDLPAISDVSEKYATYLTPAGYAFSIWSLIYLLLIVFVVYQARDIFKPRKENKLPLLVGPYFIIASLCNGLWTYVFVNELIGLSVAILVLLTASLYVLLWRLRIAIEQPLFTYVFCVWWPLMIYTGWVTAASIVNIASWFESIEVVITPLVAGIILVLLAVILLVLLFKRNVRELLFACIWAIVAVGVQQLQPAGEQIVAIVAFTTAGVLMSAVMVHAYKNRHSNVLKNLRHR